MKPPVVAFPPGSKRLTLTRGGKAVCGLVYHPKADRLYYPNTITIDPTVLEWVKACVGALLKRLTGCKLHNVSFGGLGDWGFRFNRPKPAESDSI